MTDKLSELRQTINQLDDEILALVGAGWCWLLT